MSMETALRGFLTGHASLSPLIGTRLHPVVAPQSPTFPYVVFSRVGNDSFEDLDGSAGLEAVRMQFDIYARTFGETVTIREALKGIMQDELDLEVGGVRFRGANYESDVDISDGELDLYHSATDYTIWHH